MSTKPRIFYSALLLTGVNLLLRLVGTSFQVYLSSQIGPEGIGLLQLVMSVASLSMVASMAGIRTATMYLTAEELGKNRPGNVRWVLSGCIGYSILCSIAVAVTMYGAAPFLAERWIGNSQITTALRLCALFLPVNCLTGVLVGHFTGANRIGTLAAVEVAEQLCSMVCTVLLLHFWAGQDGAKCCQAVVMGSGLSGCLTLLCLSVLRVIQRQPAGERIPVARRLMDVAVPLALADDLKTGINTVENLMVPKRLARFTGALSPLAAFGVVSGMVFPVLMFPACILYGLAELLIPELARCVAAGSRMRIRYLARRSMKLAAVYGVLFGGLMFLLSDTLCKTLYQNTEAGQQLRLYALLIPMLYCDAIVDAMTKGLGQQKSCVRYNILTSLLDVVFLYILLPKYGMNGYFLSFLATHLLNFGLSLRLLLKITGLRIRPAIPLLTVLAMVLGVWVVSYAKIPGLCLVMYPVVLGCLLYLMKILRRTDLVWMKGLILGRSV